MPIALAPAIGVALNVGGQLLNANSARKGAKAQKKGIANAKIDVNTNYDKAQEYQDPYVNAGKQTIGDLATGLIPGGEFNRNFTMADFAADPGYQFRQEQGQRAVDQSAAARGGVLSGSAIKASQKFGQGLADQTYQSAYERFNNDLNNRFNRLSSVATKGQHAADVSTESSQRRGDTLGNLSINKGNVNAAKEIAYGNAEVNALNSVGNAVGSMINPIGSVMPSAGSTIADYTGPQMQDWIKKQSGGTTSYGY